MWLMAARTSWFPPLVSKAAYRKLWHLLGWEGFFYLLLGWRKPEDSEGGSLGHWGMGITLRPVLCVPRAALGGWRTTGHLPNSLATHYWLPSLLLPFLFPWVTSQMNCWHLFLALRSAWFPGRHSENSRLWWRSPPIQHRWKELWEETLYILTPKGPQFVELNENAMQSGNIQPTSRCFACYRL